MSAGLPYRLLNGSDPLPAWIEEWVTRVIADLQGDDPVDFALGLVVHSGHRGVWHVEGEGPRGAVVFGEDDLAAAGHSGSDYHRLLLAERIQEEFVERTDAHAQARPPCPGHPHPAVPAENGHWICPSTRRDLGQIGDL